MKPLRAFLVLLLVATSLPLASCSQAAVTPPGLPNVVAVETFLADIAQNVAGDRLKVESLLPRDVDPHEYQPRPLDMIRLAKAQVLIVNGLGYESWLQKSLDGLEGQRLIITATAGLTPLMSAENGISAPDPHMWMDPLNVVEYARQIRDGLTQADLAGKDIYAANTETYIRKLTSLAAEVNTQVNTLPENRRLLVTNHDALAYFAQAYGLKVVGAVIPSVSSDTSPSAREIISLIQAIKQSGAGVIFLNLGENQKLAEQIGEETNVKVEAGLYVESLSSSGGPADTYLEMIKYDANLIVGALK